MPYLQPKTNNYFGFAPVQGNDARPVQVNLYAVSSSESIISIGDMVMLTSINTAKAITGAPFTGIMLGVAAVGLAANGGSTSATLILNTSQLLSVYDSPTQTFVVCDTTSALLGSTALYKSVAILSSGVVGSTGPSSALRSVMAISPATASSAGGPVKVIGMHPVDGIFPSGLSTDQGGAGVAASVRKWIVQPSNHIFGALDNRGLVTS